MDEKGTITKMDGDTMTVAFERSDMCARCGACKHAKEQMLLVIERDKRAREGDLVKVALPENRMLQAAFLAYGIPLIALIAGLVLGWKLPAWFSLPGNPDLYALGAGGALAILSYILLRLTEPRRAASGVYAPKVIDIQPCPAQQDIHTNTNANDEKENDHARE